MLTALLLLPLGAGTLVLADTLARNAARPRVYNPSGLETGRDRNIKNATLLGTMLLWPALFHATTNLRTLLTKPRLLIGFLWPMAMSLAELLYASDTRVGTTSNTDKVESQLTADSSSIVATAFAMGALMSGMKSVSGTHNIMFALIANLALVVPTVAMPKHSPDRVTLLALQRAALIISIAYIILGISLDFIPSAVARTHNQPSTVSNMFTKS